MLPACLAAPIHVDVRPALDDVTGVVDRLRALPWRLADAWRR
jgi:hypothetical protein